MNKKMKTGFLIILVITMCLPLLGVLLGVKNQNAENRQLKTFPKFSTNFTIEFEEYWQDQFPFRNQMITGYNQLNQLFLNYSGNPQVVLGKEDMLFFSETLDEFQNTRPFSSYELKKIENHFNLINTLLNENNIDLVLMVVPNKNEIYPDYMPNHIKPVSDQDNYDNVHNLNFDFEIINLKETFQKQSEQIYHNYDSHYNNLGAAIAADLILEKITEYKPSYANVSYQIKRDFVSDLTTMLYPSSIIYDNNMDYGLEQNYIHIRPMQSVDDITIQTLNQNQEDNLYFIRDSFGRALIPFISNALNKVHYSRISPYYFQEAINQEYENVLVEIAQRNMFHWLKGTPVIEVNPIELSILTSQGESLTVHATQDTKHQMQFLNVRIDNQEMAEQITQAFIKTDQGTYPVFMIFDSGEFTDRDYDFGFSLYTQEKLDLNNAQLIYELNGNWVQSALTFSP